MRTPRKRFAVARRARNGVMLLIVTLVLTALTLGGAALLTLMKTENEASTTRGRESLVKGVDRSAVVMIVGALEKSREEREQLGGLYNNPNLFCAKPLLTYEEGGADSSSFTVISPKLVDSRVEGIRYGLVDESTRLNLDAVLAWDRESPGSGRAALMKLPGMTQIAADSILDWIDPDENARQYGAEARYYSDKNLPYSPRNAIPVFLEELLLARGVTRSQLYGSDENFTYGVESLSDDAESDALGGSLSTIPNARAQNNDDVPWKELVTVFSAEKDVDPKGEARVDLNVDNLQFLYQELSSRVGEDLAKFVVLYRQYGPVETEPAPTSGRGGARTGAPGRRASGYNRAVAGRRGAPGAASATTGERRALSQATLDYSVEPTTRLTTPLDLVGAVVAVGDVSYASPLADSRSTENANRIFTMLDYCSTSDSTTIVGRVNVNAAPRAIISAIPGLASADVESVIRRRPDPSASLPADYRHATWLYTKGLVSLAQMKNLYNKTTARGDVYRGQIVGFLERSDETSRAEVVVDGTTEPPRQVFYKDLTTLGKGFTDAELLGGSTSSVVVESSDSAIDWDAATGVVDIDYRHSGYVQTDDSPFAALDRAESDLAALEANATANANSGALETPDAPPPTTTTTTATTPSALGADPLVPEASTTSSGGETQQSRRDRMLQTLQSAREGRRARNQEMANSTPSPTANAANESPTPAPDAAGGGGGGRANNRGGNQNQAGGGETNESTTGGGRANRRGDGQGGGQGGRQEANSASGANADSNENADDRRERALEALRAVRGDRENRD